MARRNKDTTAVRVIAAYDAIVALGASGELGERASQMREAFQRRTGPFDAEDAWFEARSRAFWDDALTTEGFAALALEAGLLADVHRRIVKPLARAHRGFFLVTGVDDGGALLCDLWSGAELLVQPVDDAQAIALEHARGAVDARVVAGPDAPDDGALFVLPGAYHHSPEALEPSIEVLAGARDRAMSTGEALDALLRMDHVFRSSSRVKASFAYRVEGLPRAR